MVVTAIHPRTTFLEQVDRAELPADFVTDIERQARSGVVKINLALAELLDFTADPGTEVGEHHTGAIAMALSVDYIEQAFQDAKQGRGATRPFSDGCIPTVFDKTLAPEGVHVMSLFTQWCPHEWSEAPHTEELEAYADRMIDCYAELAPNLKGAILHREVIGPWQMEQEWGLVGGNIFHGELSADQLFHMRPPPATPTTAARSPASTRPARPPTAAAGSAASPAGRRSGPWPTASGPRAAAGEPEGACPPRAPGPRGGRLARAPARAAVGGGGGGQRPARVVRGHPGRPAVSVGGYRGTVHLVNPRYREVAGRPCHPSLADLPGPVDLAVLAVPNAALEAQLGAAAAAGIPAAVIFASRPTPNLIRQAPPRTPPAAHPSRHRWPSAWRRRPRPGWRCVAATPWGSSTSSRA